MWAELKVKENITNNISLSHRQKQNICAFGKKKYIFLFSTNTAQNRFLFLEKNVMSLKLSEWNRRTNTEVNQNLHYW